jgi:carbon-monoxide dehydrogenase medium subunit
MMNFRLALPSVLIDLNNISELFYIRPAENGGVSLGAMSRHVQVERNPLVAERAPLLHEAMPKIATPQIRSRGTIGGSIAHADPSAELVTVSLALDGRFRLRNQSGERWVTAKEFFVGMFTTQLQPDELLVEVAFPAMQPQSGWALIEVARRPHDYALVGVAAVVSLDDRKLCRHARIVLLSVGDGPMEAHQANAILIGQAPTPDTLQAAAKTAAGPDIDPGSDIHASADYRRHLAEVLTRRALKLAFARAGGEDS